MAEAFLAPPSDPLQTHVNHIDGESKTSSGAHRPKTTLMRATLGFGDAYLQNSDRPCSRYAETSFESPEVLAGIKTSALSM